VWGEFSKKKKGKEKQTGAKEGRFQKQNAQMAGRDLIDLREMIRN